MKKKVIIGLFALFVIIQLIPNDLPEVIKENPDDLLISTDVPIEIETMLRTSCYDCHSNQTNYPWYSYVAPVSWLVKRDTWMGREHLNLSAWNSLEKVDKAEVYYEIAEEVGDGEMPMKIYPIMHSNARLSAEQRQAIVNWAETAAEKLYE